MVRIGNTIININHVEKVDYDNQKLEISFFFVSGKRDKYNLDNINQFNKLIDFIKGEF